MTKLEQDLRTVFQDEAVAVPPERLHDPVGAVVRRATGIRRRRWALTAGTLAFVLMTGTGMGVALVKRPEPVQPAASLGATRLEDRPRTGIGLDILVGNVLWTADGTTWQLPWPEVADATRIPDGWVVTEITGTGAGGAVLTAAHLLRHDGRTVPIGARAEHLAVSADGRRLAFASASRRIITTARLDAGRIVDVRSTRTRKAAVPALWSGDRLVLSDAHSLGYAVWDPTRPDSEPTWNRSAELVSVVGIGPDGRSLLAVVKRGTWCLAPLDPDRGLEAGVPACDLGFWTGKHHPLVGGALSPGGRWYFDAREHTWALVDVVAASDGADAVRTAPSSDYLVNPVWADDDTVVVLTQTGQRTYALKRWTVGGAPEDVAVPGLSGIGFRLVPRHG